MRRPSRLKKPAVATAARCDSRPTVTLASIAAPQRAAAGDADELVGPAVSAIKPDGIVTVGGSTTAETEPTGRDTSEERSPT